MKVRDAIALIEDIRKCQKDLQDATEVGDGFVKIRIGLVDDIDAYLFSLIELYCSKELK